MAELPSDHVRRFSTLGLAILACITSATLGCHRTAYRQKADAEVAQLIERGQVDSRWDLLKTGIYPRRESRMYDPFCPDAEPMPPDDPVSHQLMHRVDGKKGWPHWHDNGDTFYVENPFWRAYLPRNERGVVVLDRSKAVELALVHSREYQRNLENLYLSALNVTAERFRFDVQFCGGNSTFFTADGPDRSPAGSISRMNVDTDAQARKLTATGAELLVGFANSLVWQFSGSDSYASASILNFSILQPLLRTGGRAVVLESLTQAERALLANIRQMARYQKGFYLQVVTGTSPGAGPSAGNLAIGSLSPQVSAGRGGVLGLLQSQVQIRNQEQNVLGLQGVYELLLAAHEADRIDRFQVDLALQSLLNAQNRLMSLRAAYETQLDAFKVQLGLPPEVAMEIDDPLLRRARVLDHDDRIGAGRDRCAGEDAHAGAGPHARPRRAAGGDLAHQAQGHGAFDDVLRAHRVAVHRRTVRGRQVAVGPDVLGEHEAGGLFQRQPDGRQGADVVQDQRERAGGASHSLPPAAPEASTAPA